MVCRKCGKNIPAGMESCEFCGHKTNAPVFRPLTWLRGRMLLWQENYLMGFLGALLGSSAGGLLVFGLLRLMDSTFLAGLVSLLLPVLALGLYWKFSGGISVFGFFLTTALSLLAGWLADWIVWALAIMDANPFMTFPFALSRVTVFIECSVIDPMTYYLGIAKILGCVLVGAFTFYGAYHRSNPG